jgi:hypothetical protein
MKRYYYLSINQSKVKIPSIEHFEHSGRVKSLSTLLSDKSISIITAKTNRIGELQDFAFPNEGFIPIVSETIKDLLIKHENNIETITVDFIDLDTSKKYYLIKTQQVINCIDWTKTKYIDLPVKVNDVSTRSAIGNIYINGENIKNKIFRIDGWNTYPIITEDIKNEITEYKVNGISFNEIFSV